MLNSTNISEKGRLDFNCVNSKLRKNEHGVKLNTNYGHSRFSLQI